jgi:ribonuclease Z
MHSAAKEGSHNNESKVKHLILGHYSTRYENIQSFFEEADIIFPEVLLADDGRSLF